MLRMKNGQNQRTDIGQIQPLRHAFFKNAAAGENIVFVILMQPFSGDNGNATALLQIRFFDKTADGFKSFGFGIAVQIQLGFGFELAFFKPTRGIVVDVVGFSGNQI